MEAFIKNLARGAGAILRDGFRKKIKINEKAAFWDVVTQYDLAAEEYIISRIHRKFPGHGIVAEESGERGGGKNFWVIDPLDGTRGFSRGIQHFTTCIAFVSGGTIKNSVIYDPMREELFSAARGKGAFLNGRRISVSRTADLPHALLGLYIGIGAHQIRQKIYSRFVASDAWHFKTMGGAMTMAYAAAGRADGVVCACINIGGPWDLAPAALILREAGAKVTDFKSRPFHWNSREMVAANPVLHKKIMDAFQLKKL